MKQEAEVQGIRAVGNYLKQLQVTYTARAQTMTGGLQIRYNRPGITSARASGIRYD